MALSAGPAGVARPVVRAVAPLAAEAPLRTLEPMDVPTAVTRLPVPGASLCASVGEGQRGQELVDRLAESLVTLLDLCARLAC